MVEDPPQREDLRNIQDSFVRLIAFIVLERGATGLLRGHDATPLTVQILDVFDNFALGICLIYLVIELGELVIGRAIEAYEKLRRK